MLTHRDVRWQLPLTGYNNQRQRENVEAVVAKDDPSLFNGKAYYDFQGVNFPLIYTLLRNPAIQRILPACARPPLALEPTVMTQFSSGTKVSAVAGGAGEPAWLSHSNGAAPFAQFKSQKITHCGPYLEFTVKGTVGTVQACIGLMTDDPEQTVWLMPQRVTRAESWQHIVVKTPPVPFWIEALVRDPDYNMTFLNPREMGPLSAMAPVLMDEDIDFLFLGLALWIGIAVWETFLRSARGSIVAQPAGAALARFPVPVATDGLPCPVAPRELGEMAVPRQ